MQDLVGPARPRSDFSDYLLVCLLLQPELELHTETETRSPSVSPISMPAIVCSLAAFTVASIFYGWRAHHDSLMRRQQLRERVAYMLWVAANYAQ
jgi:hypothetical protein